MAVVNVQMLQMINAGRADYMFAAPEEVDGLVAATGISSTEIRKVTFPNRLESELKANAKVLWNFADKR